MRVVVGITCLVIAMPLYAQMEQPLEWMRDITALESSRSGSVEFRQAGLIDIRQKIEAWIELHPNSEVDLPPAPERPWSEEQLRNQIGLLKQAIGRLIENDPNGTFNPGLMVVNVTAS